MGINVLFEIGHAKAGRGRMFTWPSPEHSQVPLAHITLRYSCHQALASGAERVRDTEQRQRGMVETKRQRQSKEEKHGGKRVELGIPTLFNSICPYVNFQRAAAERSDTAGPRSLWFCGRRLSLEASQHSKEPAHFFGE